MRFADVNTSGLYETIVGKAVVEVSTDNLHGDPEIATDGDYGKKIVFKFPNKGLMTNKKRLLEIKEYKMEKADQELVIENEKRLVTIYAIIDRKSINNGLVDATLIEGEYVGRIPVVAVQYSRPLRKVDPYTPVTPNLGMDDILTQRPVAGPPEVAGPK